MNTKRPNPRIVDDLSAVYQFFPLCCLLHLRANLSRLIRKAYVNANGGACPFALMTEILALEQRITSRASLIAFFGGDPHAEVYEAPKALVRLWDNPADPVAVARYGTGQSLSVELLQDVLTAVISCRQFEQQQSQTSTGENLPESPEGFGSPFDTERRSDHTLELKPQMAVEVRG